MANDAAPAPSDQLLSDVWVRKAEAAKAWELARLVDEYAEVIDEPWVLCKFVEFAMERMRAAQRAEAAKGAGE